MRERLKTRYIQVRVSPNEEKHYKYFCEKLRLTKSELFRMWIAEKQPVYPITAEMEEKLDELLQLGEAVKQIALMAAEEGYLKGRDVEDMMRLSNDLRRLRQDIKIYLEEPKTFRFDESIDEETNDATDQ